MKLIYCIIIGIYSLFVLPAVVYADVAPMKTAIGFNLSVPGKSPLIPQQNINKKAKNTPPIGVAMARESVSIVVYPSMMTVHVDFDMKNITSEDIVMTVGFPHQTALMSGLPMTDFSVRINGLPASARYETLTYEIEGETNIRETWWLFDVTFSKNKNTSITVEYRQPFIGYNRQPLLQQGPSTDSSYIVQAGYIFQTGALWDGPIGEVALNVRTTGLEKSEKLVFFDGVHQWPEDGRWIKKDWEPTSDWLIEIAIHPRRMEFMQELSAPYDMAGLSATAQLEDRLIRFARTIETTNDREITNKNPRTLVGWKAMIETLKAAAVQNSDTALKSWANRCLSIWRRHLLNSMSLNRDATHLAYALEWLNPDNIQSEEMNDFNQKIQNKTSSEKEQRALETKTTKQNTFDENIMFYLTNSDYSNSVFTDPEVFLDAVDGKIRRERFIFFGSIFGSMCVIFVVIIVRTIKRRKKSRLSV